MTYDQMSDAERIQTIKQTIFDAGDQVRLKYPVLKHQDAIGATIMTVCVMALAASTYGYYLGYYSAWMVVLFNALVTSVIHELEHDLIHRMYFRGQAIPHNIMMALCWITRPGTVSPWIRRHLHILHHKVSGTKEDLEERGITNGHPWGVKRLLMLADNMLSVMLRLPEAKRNGRMGALLKRMAIAYFPLGFLYFGAWYAFLIFHTVDTIALWMGTSIQWSHAVLENMAIIDFMAVVVLIPFAIRSFSINLVSSNMHYYGDVELGNTLQQTQVLTPWYLVPFQLFCCNFGNSHAIHHFVVRDPFYIRELTVKKAHKIMREMGVRFNDTNTFFRANSFNAAKYSARDIQMRAISD